MGGWRGYLDALLDVIFPPLCHVCRCHIPDPDSLHICPSCLAGMPAIAHPLCTVCGEPFAGRGGDHPCGACLSRLPGFDMARAAMPYEGSARDLIHSFKYRHKSHLKHALSQMMARRLAGEFLPGAPDIVVAVPLHPRRLRQRGFNQSMLLADGVSRVWGVPLERRALCRIRWTEPQADLTAEERHANVRGAFDCRLPDRVAGRRVLLVDDVLTTGSTVDECARVLKGYGARAVLVAAAARALSGRSP